MVEPPQRGAHPDPGAAQTATERGTLGPMRDDGLAASPLRDRAPVWPEGVVASLSHTAGLCLAVAARARDWRGLGVDLERALPLDPGLVPTIASPAELDRLAPLRARPVYIVQIGDARHFRAFGPDSMFGNVAALLGLENAWTAPTETTASSTRTAPTAAATATGRRSSTTSRGMDGRAA